MIDEKKTNIVIIIKMKDKNRKEHEYIKFFYILQRQIIKFFLFVILYKSLDNNIYIIYYHDLYDINDIGYKNERRRRRKKTCVY